MNADNLVQYTYVSSAVAPMTDSDLLELLAVARKNNSSADITGMLVYSEGGFLQVLEGDRETVDDVFEKIRRDQRHKGVLKLLESPVSTRAFSDWTMGFAQASRSDLMALEGCNDFFASGRCLDEVDGSKAKTILEAFKKRARAA